MMTKTLNHEDLAIAAARVTLLALIEQHPAIKPVGQYHLLMKGKTLGLVDEEEAVARLAQLVKPLACSSRIKGATLEISCRPVFDDEQLKKIHSYLITRLGERKGVVGELLSQILPSNQATAQVELRGTSRALRVTAAALETWARDYLVIGEFAMSIDEAVPGPAGAMMSTTITLGTVKQVPIEEVFKVVRQLRDSDEGPPKGD